MPTYEYACKECGQHTEAVQAFTDDPLTVCPNCGGPLRKVFGNIGISFKGSGFYKNDSRSSTSSSSTSGAAAKGEGSSETSTKPEPAAAKSEGGSTPATTTKSEPSKPAAAAS